MKNYYEILEVNEKASKEVINKAYKVLIKKYHPDLYEGKQQKDAEIKTKEINEAYRILSDEFLKEQYDTELARENQQQTQNSENEVRKNKIMNENKKNHGKGSTKKSNVGTLDAIIELTKNLIGTFKNREKREEIKEVTKKDVIAFILTIIVVIVIGVALWFIPFTNGWMRELLFENPIFSWIGKLFL